MSSSRAANESERNTKGRMWAQRRALETLYRAFLLFVFSKQICRHDNRFGNIAIGQLFLIFFFFFKFLSVEFIIWKWIKVDCNSRIEIGAFSLFQGRARALFHIPCNRIKGLIKQPITCVSHSLVRRCSHYGELTEAMAGGVGGDIEVTCLGPIKYLFENIYRFYPLLSSLVLSPLPLRIIFSQRAKEKGGRSEG